MSGKTLIDTNIRNEVLGFLQEVAVANPAGSNLALKAGDLYQQMKPKFIKGKEKIVWPASAVTEEFATSISATLENLSET